MDVLFEFLGTLTGLCIATGVMMCLLTFIVPLFIRFKNTWENTRKLVIFTDIGLSTGAAAIGVGLLFAGSYWFFRLSFLFFAFAGYRIFRRKGEAWC